MKHSGHLRAGLALERFSEAATSWAGSTVAFVLAVGVVVIWLITGPLFHFSDTWQLVINTGTTILTFLMVFLIQRSQNKHALAISLKLNELIASTQGASNRLIDVESLSEHELEVLHRHFHTLVKMALKDTDLTKARSIEEAGARHELKIRRG